MNNITDLLDLEDSDIKISDIIIEGQTKTYYRNSTCCQLLSNLWVSHALSWCKEKDY